MALSAKLLYYEKCLEGSHEREVRLVGHGWPCHSHKKLLPGQGLGGPYLVMMPISCQRDVSLYVTIHIKPSISYHLQNFVVGVCHHLGQHHRVGGVFAFAI